MPENPTESSRTVTLYVKNMVCARCIRTVRETLSGLGLDVRNVALGEVEVGGTLEELPVGKIKSSLEREGFELIEDRRVRTIEDIKHAVLKLVQQDQDAHPVRIRDSEFIAEEVKRDYHSLSTLFSSVEGITLEHYIILQRIERVKELLKYGELTLSEIAYKLGYSSVAHLSNQFKHVTGMTPTKFKSMGVNTRKPLDKVGS